LVEDIDPRVISIQSAIDNTVNCCSAVNVIDTRTASIYDVDRTILSLVEDIDPRVISIQSAIDNTVNCCSAVNVIDTRTSSIYSTDQTILSYVSDIDNRVITIQSAVSNTQNCCSAINTIDTRTASIYSLDQLISSKIDNININNSLLNVIDTRTASIYSLDQTIAANVNTIQSTVNNIYILEQTINSKIDALQSAVSNTQNCCSAINAIDTRTNSIFSLDQTIASIVSAISSKVDVDIAIDRSTQSIVNVIDTRTASIYSLDQTINSKLDVLQSSVSNTQNCCSAINVIDTRTNSIFSLDQVINSKIDNININNSLINVINTRTSSIYSLDQTIASIVSNISSKVDTDIAIDQSTFSAVSALSTALSNCCTGTTANQAFTSIFGSQIAEGSLDNISIQFQYGVTSAPVDVYTQGGGTVTSSNSCAILSTAGSANSIAQVQSEATNAYRSGHEAYTLFTVAFTGSFVATSSQLIGPYDYQNGFAVGYNGTTFGVLQRSNAANPSVVVDTFIPQSSFNQDKLDGTGASGFTYNPAYLNVFRISFGWLGSAVAKFQILNNNGNWITFHIIYNPNSSSIPSIAQPFLPITARVENLAGTSVLTLRTASWNAGLIASPNTSSYRYNQANNTITLTVATETHVLTIRNNNTFGSNNAPNKIMVRIAAFGGGPIASTSQSATMRLRKNATVTGTTFTNVNSTNSVMAVSTAGTYSAGTGTIYLVQPSLTYSNGPNINYIPKDTYEIILCPGETATVTVVRNNAVTQTITGVVLWEERF
jgi:hypothetical protein